MNNFDFTNFNVDNATNSAFDVYNDGRANEIVHDDGFMHVSFNGIRYAFDIGQDCSSSHYNRVANQILSNIGVVGTVTGNNN